MSAKTFWTIPNLLSLYRIIIFPWVCYLLLTKQESLFTTFLIINLISDILDGWIARQFNQQTKIGAKLDSWGDLGTYILAFWGIILFKWDVILPHFFMFIVFLISRFIAYLLPFIKFGEMVGLHLYSSKSAGYIQGFFVGFLFLFGFYGWLYYLALGWGIFACLEEMLMLLILKEPVSDVRGYYWWIKTNK